MSKIDHPITVVALRKRASTVATLCSTALDDLGKSQRLPELMTDSDARLHRGLPGALTGHLRKVREFEQYLRSSKRGQSLDPVKLKEGRRALTLATQTAGRASKLLGRVSGEAADRLEVNLLAALDSLPSAAAS